MSQAYIGAIEAHCPNATLVLDRFHIVKALNEAVDEVRKQQWREASQADRKPLKGLRWLLYRHSSTRSRRDTRHLKALDKHNRRIYRAWQLKEEFEQFWTYKATWAAERFLKRWTRSTLLSRLEPMRKFVRTLRKHQSAVVAFIDTRVTNAIAEGINRIVKIVKNRASGYRHLDAFSDMIFLAVGDLICLSKSRRGSVHCESCAKLVRSGVLRDQGFASLVRKMSESSLYLEHSRFVFLVTKKA